MAEATTAGEVYQELLGRIGEAHPRPRLDPTRRLAELAGSPQLSFPVIQVAGTNGKTSTSRAIESLLRAHGLRTGLFTSPHLIDFEERFQLDGLPVTEAALVDAWSELQAPLQLVDTELDEAGHSPITFFEALTVLAFAIFADAPVDVAVVEVGMGGEWDSTNIVDARVAVFTPISLDHTEILGRDVATIARTKAGIIGPDAVVVSAEQEPEALVEIGEVALRHTARMFVANRDYFVMNDTLAVGGRQVQLRGVTEHDYEPMFLPLHGSHQAQNVSVAVAAVEAFLGAERAIPDEVLEEGFATLTSPGRLQLLGVDPIVYVDAAHNPHGAEALARAVTESFNFSELALIVGVLGEKDAAGILEALAPIATTVYLTNVDSPRTRHVEDLAGGVMEAIGDLPWEVTDNVTEALDSAREWAAQESGRAVLVAGSVLLAGEAMACARRDGWGTG